MILQVKEGRMTNNEIRSRLNNIPKVEEIQRNRKILLLGRIARIDKNSYHRKLLSETCERRRNVGRPFRTTKDSFADGIRLLIDDIDRGGTLNDWLEHALEK